MATLSKRALITGAAGFTGMHLCDYLEGQGYEVLGLQRPGATLSDENDSRFLVGDILDKDTMVDLIRQFDPTHVFHLAAIAFVAHGEPVDIYRVNVLGTEMLLSALAEAAPSLEKVVLASSANVYGNPTTPKVSETALPAPVNHYGCSKLSMEHIARTYLDRLPITIARPFNYTGPGQDPKFLVPKMVAHFRENRRTIELGNLDVTRDISDVRDVVRYYGALAAEGVVGEVYNLCRGEGIQLRDIISMLEDICGYKIDIQVNPAFVRASDIKVLIGDGTRLQSLQTGTPAYSYRQTLTDMLA